MIPKYFKKRPPDFIIGSVEDPYLYRWYIIPKNKWFNIYLHRFMRSDDDRALHDHPWWSLGMILSPGGVYVEHMPDETVIGNRCTRHRYERIIVNEPLTLWMQNRSTIQVKRRRFQPVLRRAKHIHRVELCKDEFGAEIPVYTLFITGPKIRDWGFWCPKGFKNWRDFVNVRKGGNEVGVGCDDE